MKTQNLTRFFFIFLSFLLFLSFVSPNTHLYAFRFSDRLRIWLLKIEKELVRWHASMTSRWQMNDKHVPADKDEKIGENTFYIYYSSKLVWIIINLVTGPFWSSDKASVLFIILRCAQIIWNLTKKKKNHVIQVMDLPCEAEHWDRLGPDKLFSCLPSRPPSLDVQPSSTKAPLPFFFFFFSSWCRAECKSVILWLGHSGLVFVCVAVSCADEKTTCHPLALWLD